MADCRLALLGDFLRWIEVRSRLLIGPSVSVSE